MCVSVCANGIAAGHHRRAARKPAAAPENKLTGASKVFFLEKTFGDLESFFSSRAPLYLSGQLNIVVPLRKFCFRKGPGLMSRGTSNYPLILMEKNFWTYEKFPWRYKTLGGSKSFFL